MMRGLPQGSPNLTGGVEPRASGEGLILSDTLRVLAKRELQQLLFDLGSNDVGALPSKELEFLVSLHFTVQALDTGQFSWSLASVPVSILAVTSTSGSAVWAPRLGVFTPGETVAVAATDLQVGKKLSNLEAGVNMGESNPRHQQRGVLEFTGHRADHTGPRFDPLSVRLFKAYLANNDLTTGTAILAHMLRAQVLLPWVCVQEYLLVTSPGAFPSQARGAESALVPQARFAIAITDLVSSPTAVAVQFEEVYHVKLTPEGLGAFMALGSY